jgi:hypothetical protein
MAISLGVSVVASSNSKSASTSLTVALASPGIGRVMTFVVASDNGTITAAGTSNLHTNVTDNGSGGGNTYEKIYEYTGGQGASNNGVTVSVWIAKVTVNPTITTVTFAESLTAKAAVASSWNVDSGNSLRVVATNGAQVTNNVNCTPTAISGLPSGPYLFIGAFGTEGPNGDTFTSTGANGDPTTGWGYVKVGTTGGSAISNVCSIGDYRNLATATGATVAPSLSTARDWAAAIVALEEYTPAAFEPVDPMGMMGIFGI